MLLQGDGGFDYNCTTPRGIVANLVMFIGLRLEHLVCLRNASGYSTFNPSERPMCAINFATQTLAIERLECSPETEKLIQTSKTMKDFIQTNIENNNVMKEFNDSIQPAIDMINDSVGSCKYGGNYIKIGDTVNDIEIDFYLNEAKSILEWIPTDVRTCQSKDILQSSSAKEFLRTHAAIGRYKVELFKNPDCSCNFCSLHPKSNVKALGIIPYPVKLDNDSYSENIDLLPLGSNPKELDCPSANGESLTKKCVGNKNKLNVTTVRGYWACDICGKDRALYGSKRGVPKAFIEYLYENYLPFYNYTCGDHLYPDNKIECVDLPDERWKEEKARLEFRHNLTCKSVIEVQVSF